MPPGPRVYDDKTYDADMAVIEDPVVEPHFTREEGRWTHQWKELYEEVITSGLCTGCSACVIACPHDVIGYEHVEGGYKPFHLEDELGESDCVHGQKGCTSCTRACPRFRDWEPAADEHLFGRLRETEEVHGIAEQRLLVRASDAHVHELGQDGGLVSAILIWLLDEAYVDGALVSYLEGDGSTWRAKPGVATNRQEVLDAALEAGRSALSNPVIEDVVGVYRYEDAPGRTEDAR